MSTDNLPEGIPLGPSDIVGYRIIFEVSYTDGSPIGTRSIVVNAAGDMMVQDVLDMATDLFVENQAAGVNAGSPTGLVQIDLGTVEIAQAVIGGFEGGQEL